MEYLSQERLKGVTGIAIAHVNNSVSIAEMLGNNTAIAQTDQLKVILSEIKRLQAIEAEHIALQTIIENARRLAFFRAEEEEPGPRFKMDANGNLERINE